MNPSSQRYLRRNKEIRDLLEVYEDNLPSIGGEHETLGRGEWFIYYTDIKKRGKKTVVVKRRPMIY